MKKLFAVIALSLSSIAAFAAPLTDKFVADDGRIFQTNDVVSVDWKVGEVVIVHTNGQEWRYPDATGNVFNKVKASPTFPTNFVGVAGSNRYIALTHIIYAKCNGSGHTEIKTSNFQDVYLLDGCQLWQAIKAQSN